MRKTLAWQTEFLRSLEIEFKDPDSFMDSLISGAPHGPKPSILDHSSVGQASNDFDQAVHQFQSSTIEEPQKKSDQPLRGLGVGEMRVGDNTGILRALKTLGPYNLSKRV